MRCYDWLRLIFPPKILAIVKQPANCVHMTITRESVMISSTHDESKDGKGPFSFLSSDIRIL